MSSWDSHLVQDQRQFRRWLIDAGPSVLWCSGNIGTGKTIVTSSVVAHLNLVRRASEEVASLSARNIIGSIARQMLEFYVECASTDELESLYTQSRYLEVQSVVSFLSPRLSPNATYFVILDGLDECETKDVESVMRTIKALLNQSGRKGDLKIFIASRPSIEHTISKCLHPTHHMSLTTNETNLDIGKYVEATLDSKLQNEELKLGNPALILEIQNVLVEGARGM